MGDAELIMEVSSPCDNVVYSMYVKVLNSGDIVVGGRELRGCLGCYSLFSSAEVVLPCGYINDIYDLLNSSDKKCITHENIKITAHTFVGYRTIEIVQGGTYVYLDFESCLLPNPSKEVSSYIQHGITRDSIARFKHECSKPHIKRR